MNTATQVVPAGRMRRELRDVLDAVVFGHRAVAISRHGRIVAKLEPVQQERETCLNKTQ